MYYPENIDIQNKKIPAVRPIHIHLTNKFVTVLWRYFQWFWRQQTEEMI